MATPEEILTEKIKRIYSQAAKEVKRKTADFWKAHKRIAAQMLADVKAGKITQADYKKWLKGQVFTGERWEQKLDDITKVYVDADKKAREIIGGTAKNVFVDFANITAYGMEKELKGAVSFDLYDAKTVERLLKDNPKMLPEWKIDEPKDYIWNEKRVQNAVTQGIVQGEAIADIGNRLVSELSTSNGAKMDMFARTAVTGAQNAGRMERLHEAEEMGIEVKKQWIAAHDNRVRDTHAYLDGQIVGVDESFKVDGMEIAYPGDPLGPPELVYNCRCTLAYIYPKYQKQKRWEDTITGEEKEWKTFKEWKEEKRGRQKQEKTQLSKQTLKSIDEFIEGRGNKFTEHEVDEIINNMQSTKEPLYRVEDLSWMGENLEIGDTFEFDKPLKSFTQNFEGVEEIVAEGDDAGLYGEVVALFQTVDKTQHFDVTGMSRNHAEEFESLVSGEFVVVDEHDGPIINGHNTWIFEIQQLSKRKKK